MLSELNDVLTKWEGLWLFIVLLAGLLIEAHSNYMLRKEYEYDEQKDLAKKRRTKTTKKTTVSPSGDTVIEEQTESVESKGENNV